MSFVTPITTPANARDFNYNLGGLYGVQSGTNFNSLTVEDLFSASIPAAIGSTLLEGPLTLDPKFLGIHLSEPAQCARIKAGTISTHDSGMGRWSQMNPIQGRFYDGKSTGAGYVDTDLKGLLKAIKASGADSFHKIYESPTWASARPAEGNSPYGMPGGRAEPSNMTYLTDFVTWLMNYCGEYIDYLGVWNEPKYNTLSSSYYSGTPAKLAEMARVINLAAKAVKPSIKIVGVDCTGVTSNGVGSGIDYFGQFLAASDGSGGTGKDWIDILSVHPYESAANDLNLIPPVKGFLDNLKTANSVTGKVVWSTEWGYVNPTFNNYTGPVAARMKALFRYALLNIVAGMERCISYHYTGNMGWSSSPEGDRLWNEMVSILNGGAVVTRINRIGLRGALACVINGKNYLV